MFKGCSTTVPPLWCPPRKRWWYCSHSLSQPMPEGTWCWAALDNNDRAWSGERFHYLALRSPSSKTSYLSDAHYICYHLEPLHPKESPRRVDGGMLIGETQRERDEKWKEKSEGVSIGKPASCLVRFSCQCRSNMTVDDALLAASHYKMSMPCPSGPAVR